jgi:hypothetical protein
VVGELEVTKATPTYYVNEGCVVLRAPRTKGEFRMLHTWSRKFKEVADFAARGIIRIQFQLILDSASREVMRDCVHGAHVSS